jgi:nucleoside-diphosphate-sugar epimerase
VSAHLTLEGSPKYFIKRALDRRARVVLPYDGRSVFQTTATVNLAAMVALAAAKPGQRTFNCADEKPPTVAEISATVDNLMGWSTEPTLVAGPPPEPTVGDHPWCVPRAVVADMVLARDSFGYREVASYREALAATLPWALDACSGRDWREVFPTLVGYPTDFFDYDAEDKYLKAIDA